MTVEEILGFITYISAGRNILGIDICGEPENTAKDGDIFASDSVNKKLYDSLTKLI